MRSYSNGIDLNTFPNLPISILKPFIPSNDLCGLFLLKISASIWIYYEIQAYFIVWIQLRRSEMSHNMARWTNLLGWLLSSIDFAYMLILFLSRESQRVFKFSRLVSKLVDVMEFGSAPKHIFQRRGKERIVMTG